MVKKKKNEEQNDVIEESVDEEVESNEEVSEENVEELEDVSEEAASSDEEETIEESVGASKRGKSVNDNVKNIREAQVALSSYSKEQLDKANKTLPKWSLEPPFQYLK